MPVLPITDGRGKLYAAANLRVLATMMHPDDPEARERLLEALTARALVECGAPISRKQWRLATERGAQADSLMDEATHSAYGLAVTGDLLLMIASAAAYSPENASLARAVRVWCEDQAKGRTQAGRKVAASERAVMTAWAKFKPVAHLCAAMQLHRDFGDRSQLDLCDPKQLPNFLGAAEALRIFGATHHPPAGRFVSRPSRATTLDSETTWVIPPDLRLPAVSLEVPIPTPFALKIFSEYQAD